MGRVLTWVAIFGLIQRAREVQKVDEEGQESDERSDQKLDKLLTKK